MMSMKIINTNNIAHITPTDAVYILEKTKTNSLNFVWLIREAGSTGKAEVKLAMLSLLCTAAQKQLPYHYPKIEGNDILFGGTIDYQKEINTLIDTHIKEVLEILAKLKESSDLSVCDTIPKILLIFPLERDNWTLLFKIIYPGKN